MRAHEGLSMYHRCSIFQRLVKGIQVFFCIGPPEPPWRISESERGFFPLHNSQIFTRFVKELEVFSLLPTTKII